MYQPLPRTKRSVARLLLLCSIFHLCLGISGQSTGRVTPKINLSAKNVTITDVFKAIKSQTGKIVWFMNEEVNADKKVTVSFENASLDEVMKTLFGAASDFTWSFDNEKVILRKKKQGEDNVITSGVEPSSVRVDSVPNTITVTGKVTDEKGSPIIGATVVVKGTRVGTKTGVDGAFVLEGVKGKAVLVVSSISFLAKEIYLQGKSFVGNVSLKNYVEKLDETVIIGYGTTTTRLNVGNVVSIKANEIEEQPVSNPLYALQGRVAGLQITPTTGLAGSAVNLQIRGKNSLNFQSDPLIVIDGLPIVNNISGLGNLALNQLSSLSFINPNEIESIDVLKDADATSVYGSRGANGVILITTKKGKAGDIKSNLNIQTGWATVERRMSLLNTSDYLQMRKEAFTNSGIDFINTFPYGIPEYKYIFAPDLFVWDQNRYTDWQKELIGKAAKYNDFQGSVSGGSSTIQFNIGGNYHKETTVFKGNNSDEKGSVRMSLVSISTNQKFKASLSAGYMMDKNTLPGTDFTSLATTLPPNAPKLYNSDGSLNWEPLPSGNKSWDNPYEQLFKTYAANVNNLITSADISYKFFQSLTIKTTLGYNILSGRSFRKTSPLAGRSPEGLLYPFAGAAFNSNGIKNFNIEPQINYSFTIGRGSANILIGSTIQNTQSESEQIDANGFQSDAQLKNLAAATSYSISNSFSEYRYCAIFGRVSYNWDNRYLLNLNARRDGSSRFGPRNQFGNFGSIGAAWIMSSEKFFKSAFPFISYGKLRFSYGTSGNDGVGDYAYLERYTTVEASDPYQGIRGYSTTGLYNPYYAWEVTKKREVGVELGIFKDRILFSTSYFRNRSNNQLVSYPYPSMAGPGSSFINFPALVQNSGVEVTINTRNVISNKFSWSTAFNFTSNRNKLVSFPNIQESAYYGLYEVGMPFNGISKTYNYSGVDPETGKYEYTTLDQHKTFSPEDLSRLDYGLYLRIFTQPKFYGGISNQFSFKRFKMDVFFQFSKQLGTNPMGSYIAGIAGFMRNLPTDFLNRWQKPGDVTNFQKVGATYTEDLANSSSNYVNSNANYVDASFMRLKNLSISYDIPIRKQKVGSQALRIFLQCQNLWTITKYKGLDPETQSTGSLPPLRVLTIGFSLTL